MIKTMKQQLHIYTRVSSETQVTEGFGIENQTSVGMKLSKKLGFEPIIHNEGSKSSHNDDITTRPVLTRIMDMIDKGEIKNLYVFNTDRLSRNQQVWNFIRLRLTQNKVSLYVSEGTVYQLDDPMDDFIFGVMSEVSKYDNSIRTNRLRMGKLSKVKTGGWMGGPTPFGYKNEDGKLVPDNYEKRWVKKIYEEYSNGNSFYEIRRLLMRNGVLSRRKLVLWNSQSIKKILMNTHYEGYWFYTDKKLEETVRCEVPKILSSKLVKSVRDRIQSLKQTGNREKYESLLRTSLSCFHCGSPHGTRVYPDKRRGRYFCRGNEIIKSKNNLSTEKLCKIENGRVRSLDIEDTDILVWNTIIKVLSKSNLFKEVFKTDLMGSNSHSKTKEEIQKYKKQVKEIDKKIVSINDGMNGLVVEGVINKVDVKSILSKFEEKKSELFVEKDNLLEIIQSSDTNKKWINWVKEFGSRINDLQNSELSLVEKKRFLEGVVDKIIVKTTSKQTHELSIQFTERYVGDKLEWKTKDKKKGYDIINGVKNTLIELNTVDRRKKKN